MAKMRLLTFMGMAVEFKEISFDTMQQELQIGADDVEAFVIDGKKHFTSNKPSLSILIKHAVSFSQLNTVIEHWPEFFVIHSLPSSTKQNEL